jgi:hypothetical protein
LSVCNFPINIDLQILSGCTHPRKKRWDALNKILDAKIEKAKVAKRRRKSVGDTVLEDVEEVENLAYSSVTWSDVEKVLNLQAFHQRVENLTEGDLTSLTNYLRIVSKVTGPIPNSNEATRLHYIFPVLAIVCNAVSGVKILFEETISGKNIHVTGRFEFVLSKNDRYVGIVEAKKFDLNQGKTQALLGCEALVDCYSNGQVVSVCAVVTTFTDWIFCVSDTDGIKFDFNVLDIGECFEQNDMNPLNVIAGKIFAMLTDI